MLYTPPLFAVHAVADARILLTFNNPVDPALLRAALELRPALPDVAITVTACDAPTSSPYNLQVSRCGKAMAVWSVGL